MSKEAKTTRELSYYELYLLDYLRQHKFTQQHDRDFIRTRSFTCWTTSVSTSLPNSMTVTSSVPVRMKRQRPTSRNDGTDIHQTRHRNWPCRHSPRGCTILSMTSF